jgi:hypothetical protein
MASLNRRSNALWLLGYPEAALADTNRAIEDAREIGHAMTLFMALGLGPLIYAYCGNYVAAKALKPSSMSLLLWRKKKVPRTGPRKQSCPEVIFLP